MKCPACSNTLQQVVANDVELDVCQNGCGGIWFDNFEIKKFDEQHEPADILLEIQPNSDIKVDLSDARYCPRCDNIKMLRHYFSVKHQVEVDECQSCGGLWLDYGELGKIRGLFETEQQRLDAAHESFDKNFGEMIAMDLEESEHKLQKARRIANLFKFICPSAYIPGKQSWGSF